MPTIEYHVAKVFDPGNEFSKALPSSLNIWTGKSRVRAHDNLPNSSEHEMPGIQCEEVVNPLLGVFQRSRILIEAIL